MVPFPHLLILIASLQYVIAAWASAFFPADNPTYNIAERLTVYLAYTGPAIVAISGASIGYLLGPLGWAGRIFLYVAAAALFYPSTYSDFAGVVLVLAFLGWRWRFGSSRTM